MIRNISNFNSFKNGNFYKATAHSKCNKQQIWHYNNMCDSISFKGINKSMQANSSDMEKKIAEINNAFSQKDIEIIATSIKKMSLYDFDELMQKLKTHKYCGDSLVSWGYNFDLENNITDISIVIGNNKTFESEICIVQIEDFLEILDLLRETCCKKNY